MNLEALEQEIVVKCFVYVCCLLITIGWKTEVSDGQVA